MPNALAVLNACVSALITLLLIGLLEALLNNGNDLDLTLFKLDLNFLSWINLPIASALSCLAKDGAWNIVCLGFILNAFNLVSKVSAVGDISDLGTPWALIFLVLLNFLENPIIGILLIMFSIQSIRGNEIS